MKNLVVIFITLVPFIGLSQQTLNEEETPSSKIYYESGTESFSIKYHEKKPTEIGLIIKKITIENQPINHFKLYKDECRTTRNYEKQTTALKANVDNFFTIRVYESSKIYHEIKVPTNSKKRLYTIHNQHR